VEGLEEARRAIGTLRGDALPGPERLPALVEAFEEQSGVRARLETVGSPRALPTDASLALYRTAQEALTNIRRHAVPDSVTVRLEYRDDATLLAVEDVASQGPAIPVGAPAGSGYGLTGMRERAELLDGRLTAEPTAQGFRVELWLPR
jgi:signal transduction histidine kinase